MKLLEGQEDFIENLKNTEQTEFNEIRFHNSINSTNFTNLRNKENNEGFDENFIDNTGKKTRFFNMGFKNDWRKLLSKDIIDKMNLKFEDELKELGYN